MTAIEANSKAFLKCLLVQNALKFKADFLFGDFRPYLETCPKDSFDVLIASGVLYHMNEPAKLLSDMARVSSHIGIWTHYYDPEILLKDPHKRKFNHEAPRVERFGSREVVLYQQSHLEALDWGGFCGGSASTSYWLTRESLLGVLEGLGLKVEVGAEDKNHPSDPYVVLFASR